MIITIGPVHADWVRIDTVASAGDCDTLLNAQPQEHTGDLTYRGVRIPGGLQVCQGELCRIWNFRNPQLVSYIAETKWSFDPSYDTVVNVETNRYCQVLRFTKAVARNDPTFVPPQQGTLLSVPGATRTHGAIVPDGVGPPFSREVSIPPLYTPSSIWVEIEAPVIPYETQSLIRNAVLRWRALVPDAPDYEIAGYALADVVRDRLNDARDENGRNAEYAICSWIGGHLLQNPSAAPDTATLFYETVWQNPAAVAGYNSRKWATERVGLGRFIEADKGHPASEPGGFDLSVDAWNRGRQGRSLDSLLENSPAVPDTSRTEPEEAEEPLDLNIFAVELPFEIFALNVGSSIATLFDPPVNVVQEYRAAVGPRFASVGIPDLQDYADIEFTLMVNDELITVLPGMSVDLYSPRTIVPSFFYSMAEIEDEAYPWYRLAIEHASQKMQSLEVLLCVNTCLFRWTTVTGAAVHRAAKEHCKNAG